MTVVVPPKRRRRRGALEGVGVDDAGGRAAARCGRARRCRPAAPACPWRRSRWRRRAGCGRWRRSSPSLMPMSASNSSTAVPTRPPRITQSNWACGMGLLLRSVRLADNAAKSRSAPAARSRHLPLRAGMRDGARGPRPARNERCTPLLDATASGVYVIAVTPFLDDGRLDEPSTDRMVDFYARLRRHGSHHPRHHGRGAEARHRRGHRLRPPRGEALGQDARHRRRVVAGLCRHAGAGARRHGGGCRRRDDRAARRRCAPTTRSSPISPRPSRRSAPTCRS